ncbi:hypothetical protein BTE28158_04912 [Burkholderia territorii]|nr:hypothetical protein BTE28158_04912 [Burkholderia territorii]
MRRLSEGLAALPIPCFSPDAGTTRIACLRHRNAMSL